ncbi:lamin tail domain-containing protein [Neolewinella antarctica]|uniref:LTD domain-containing protein n=1 Tax=Neolewinella antarctica TaxID=442734 RepID=A0ABX0XDY4_9BACT|nr:lamin tail domain-containing protein [Neolewinella antarctica]NJC27518.1 hypothetical protein [Neolewinella antarctica]
MFRFLLSPLLLLTLATTLQAQTTLPAGALAINEFVADNDSTSNISDPDGGYPDWIELYNTTDAAIDLSDTYISDKDDDRLKFKFPAGTAIAADGYLLLWADEDLDQQGIHVNFKLSRGGEAIYLSNADGSTIDGTEFGEQTTNQSLSRVPNGTGPFVAQRSTPGFDNETPVSTRGGELNDLVKVSPNPASDRLTIDLPENTKGRFTVEVRTLDGRIALPGQEVNGIRADLSVATLPAGLYLLRIRDEAGRSGIVRFSKR